MNGYLLKNVSINKINYYNMAKPLSVNNIIDTTEAAGVTLVASY